MMILTIMIVLWLLIILLNLLNQRDNIRFSDVSGDGADKIAVDIY